MAGIQIGVTFSSPEEDAKRRISPLTACSTPLTEKIIDYVGGESIFAQPGAGDRHALRTLYRR